MIWYSYLFKSFPQFVVIHTVKGFSIVIEAEVDVFLEFLAFTMILQMLAIWSDPSAFPKPSLYIWKFLIHALLKPILKDFEHNLNSMWNEHNYIIILTFFGIVLLWDWNENWLFQSCGHCWIFQICWHIECSTWLALFGVMLPKTHLTSHFRMSGLGEWPHHRGYPGHWDLLFVQFFCVFLPPLLNLFCFC